MPRSIWFVLVLLLITTEANAKCLSLQEARKQNPDVHLRYVVRDGEHCWYGKNPPPRSTKVERPRPRSRPPPTAAPKMDPPPAPEAVKPPAPSAIESSPDDEVNARDANNAKLLEALQRVAAEKATVRSIIEMIQRPPVVPAAPSVPPTFQTSDDDHPWLLPLCGAFIAVVLTSFIVMQVRLIQ